MLALRIPYSLMIRTSRVVDEGIAQGLHLGAQIYVSIGARPAIDLAIGQASHGVPIHHDTVMLYLSSGKPLAAVVAGQLMEEGTLSLDDPAMRFIPAFAGGGKDAITVRHLLNHTAGLNRSLISNWDISDWDESVAKICAYPLPPSWQVGRTAGYDAGASWLILGEILQRVTGTSFATLMRRRLFDVLGAAEIVYAWSPEEALAMKDRTSPMYDTTSGQPSRCPWSEPARVHPPLPGASARGSARQLGRFYETLMGGEILSPVTLSLLTSPSRGSVYDHTFRREMDWGLGFLVDNGPDAPYGAGVLTRPGIFGHGGQQSSLAFCDPSRHLVLVAIFNGLCGEVRHHKRLQALLQAVKEDLGL